MVKILIVEDEVNARDGLVYLIRHQYPDCMTTGAIDGVDGLDKVSEHKPDIIITDIRMPKMDGIEMIQ